MILSWLPATALLRFKSVSRSWYNLIKLHLTHSFQKISDGTLILHQNRSLYTVDFHGSRCYPTEIFYPENRLHCTANILHHYSKLEGSCNGLLCFEFQFHQLALYNPATRAFKKLPQVILKKDSVLKSNVGFGYDCVSNVYKVLRFTRLLQEPDSTILETHLYSLNTNAWEIIANPPWVLDSTTFPSFMLNNSLHWMDRGYDMIKCLDLFTLRYHDIALPNKINPDYKPVSAVLRGQLVIINSYFDIWIMKEYGVHESWTRVFRCPYMQWNSIYKSAPHVLGTGMSLGCSDNGCKILILLREQQNFICCDLETQEGKIAESVLPGQFSTMLPWVSTLAPLDTD